MIVSGVIDSQKLSDLLKVLDLKVYISIWDNKEDKSICNCPAYELYEKENLKINNNDVKMNKIYIKEITFYSHRVCISVVY